MPYEKTEYKEKHDCHPRITKTFYSEHNSIFLKLYGFPQTKQCTQILYKALSLFKSVWPVSDMLLRNESGTGVCIVSKRIFKQGIPYILQ